MEIWKTTIESDRYEVSSKGRIRNKQRLIPIVLKDNGAGYIYWQRKESGKMINSYVHRTLYKAFIGEIPNGYEINHINFDRGCNEISNLELSTHKQNMKHSRDNGRFNEADKKQSEFLKKKSLLGLNPFQNLTNEQRKKATEKWKAGYTKERHGMYGIKKK
jgi:hypothetical protein